jgi:hypothetical protein
MGKGKAKAARRPPGQREKRGAAARPVPAQPHPGGGYGMTIHGGGEPPDNLEDLHPALQDLPPGGQVNVIIGDRPAEDATLVGELKQDIRASDGAVLPEGTPVWLDPVQGSLEERAAARQAMPRARETLQVPDGPFIRPVTARRDVIIPPVTPGRGRGMLAVRVPDEEPRMRELPGQAGIPAAYKATGLPPGAAGRVAEYRDALQQGAVPAAFAARRKILTEGGLGVPRPARDPGGVLQALEAEQAGLAERLAQGLTKEELAELAPAIARAAAAGGVPAGKQLTFTTGADGELVLIEDDPGAGEAGAQPDHGTVVRTGAGPAPEGAVPVTPAESRKASQAHARHGKDRGRTIVVRGDDGGRRGDRKREKRAPRVVTVPESGQDMGPVTRATLAHVPHRTADDPLVLALRPSDVLNTHVQLASLMAHPSAEILYYYGRFIEQTLTEAAAGDPAAAREYWQGMFWPAADSRQWCGILARMLQAGRTYEITAEMCEKVAAQYEADLKAESYLIEETDLPWPAGFAWLDAPLVFTDKFGRTGMNRVISWGPEYASYAGRPRAGVRIVCWSWYDDRDSYWSERTAAAMLRQGGLSLAHSIVVPLGIWHDVQRQDGMPTQDDTVRWTRVLWRILCSEIAETAPAPHIERHVAKRALRSLRHDQVHVVTLRRKYYIDSGGVRHRNVDWSCRWVVGGEEGFWRHSRRDADWEEANKSFDENGRRRRHHAFPDETREHCATCGAKIVHVGAFIKGPKGAPLRETAKTVFVLRR